VRDDDCAYTLEALQVPQAIAFQPRIARNGRGDTGDIINALNAQSGQTGKGDSAPCVAVTFSDAAGTIRHNTRSNSNPVTEASMHVLQNWAVRRLTCEECELLQGFPIGYTLLPGKGKRKGEDLQQTTDYLIALGFTPAAAAVLAHCPDGPRYKSLGNSWAVPVFTWVGTRVERMLNHESLSQ
jgi:DNA (cytosine-5)-methyltransferase 1